MNPTKKSFLTSVIALVLCLTMFLGTTFAWFTDVVTSNGNIIQTGSLKIDLELLDKETGKWNSIKDSQSPLFDYEKWEPGYVDVKVLKVENEGNLSLKWKAMFVSDEQLSALADVIDVYVLPWGVGNGEGVGYPADRKLDGYTKVGTLKDFVNTIESTTYGTLKGGEAAYLGIALKMQDEAGNDYQQLSLGKFNIQIVATQAVGESDSFGNDYDADAQWPELESGYAASASISSSNLMLGALTSDITIGGANGVGATVPADVKIAEGATSLDLTMKKVDTDGNLGLGEGDNATSFDVHIAGIAADNTKPMTVNLGPVLQPGLDVTELKLYHTENGTPVQMTRVATAADFAIHNQYTYDPTTGNVSIYVATFSVFSATKTSADVWDGKAVAEGFASGTGTQANPYLINTAAQLVFFRNQVDAGVTYEGKFVKLNKDIDLAGHLFNPIGYGYAHNGGQAFMGTFDGGNHTIYGLYQNGWELGYSYGTQGGGLFASAKNATIKNLVVDGANIRMECVDMGIVVGYAQGECLFENIVITNSKIANYNRYTGGVVGEVCKGVDNNGDGFTHVFKNIVVDSSVVVSSLWGSFDISIGGVIGGKWGDANVKMENVIVAAELDVYSDVTAAYQWYAYRRCGMLIGHTEIDSPKKGLNVHEIEFLTCENVNVFYGDWVNYTYYEFANQDSGTGRSYPWVRAEASPVGNNGAFSNPRYGVPTHTVNGEVITVTEENANTYKTGYAEIKFDQLYGGGQGVYGKADHKGVTTTVLTDTKTIYFQNNWKWTNLKIYYWYENGDNQWTTVVDGVSLTGMSDTKVGGYDLYKFEIPAYVAGYQIEGYDSTTKTTHKTEKVLAENIIDGNIYWFLYANGEYTIATNKYETNFKTHDIYIVGDKMNNWSTENIDSKYHLTPSSDGKTWTISITFDVTTTIKLYNTLVVSEGNGGWIGGKGYESSNGNVELAPGKYTITYSVADNNFTFNMTERILYLDATNEWNKENARFAVYVWSGEGSTKKEAWYSMTKVSDNTFKVTIDAKYDNVIFCRMNGGNSTNNWNNKWNQTIDLKTGDGSVYTITKPWNGSGDKATGTWSKKQ